MQQTDQNLQIAPYQQSTGSQLVQVGETNYVQVNQRTFQITEVQPTALRPNPSAAPYPNGFWDSFKWLAVGLGGMGFFALLSYSVVRMFAPAPIPAAALAPAPPPQTIIIQPPPIEKKPFTRRDCRSDGLFGWGESCTEERGYE